MFKKVPVFQNTLRRWESADQGDAGEKQKCGSFWVTKTETHSEAHPSRLELSGEVVE